MQAGVWLQRLQSNDFLAQNQLGQASFATLAAFEQGTVAKYTVVAAPTELGWRSLFSAGFIEDTWEGDGSAGGAGRIASGILEWLE